MLNFIVDQARCTRCGECILECPSGIIKADANKRPGIAPEAESDCLQCQHCLAVCPTGAISILGRKPGDSVPLSAGSLPGLDSMIRLVRGRRSVRRYKNENADPALVKRLLAALANCPTGVNQRELTFTVIDDKVVMQRFREKAMEKLAAAARANRVPPAFEYIRDAAADYFDQGEDIILRGAPHALIVSAPPDAPCPSEDVTLTLAYFELLAQSAGLGTVWCGMLKMLLELLPELKTLIGLPPDHVYYTMLFGPPAVRYPRTVQRDDAAAIRRVSGLP